MPNQPSYPTDLNEVEWAVVKKSWDHQPSWDVRPVLPRRWVVERTFGWLHQFRRLSHPSRRQPHRFPLLCGV
jgi:transposase